MVGCIIGGVTSYLGVRFNISVHDTSQIQNDSWKPLNHSKCSMYSFLIIKLCVVRHTHTCNTHDMYSNIYYVNLWRDYIQKLNLWYKIYEGFNFFFLVILLFSVADLYRLQNDKPLLVRISLRPSNHFLSQRFKNTLKITVNKILLWWLRLKFSCFIVYISLKVLIKKVIVL